MADISTIKRWRSEAEELHTTWLDEAETDYQFYRGDQWDPTQKSRLEGDNRPVLTLNRCRSLVKLLTGYERKTRYDLRILPIGEGADDAIARIYTQLIRGVEHENRSEYAYSDMYKDGIITGRGWIKVDVNYDYNPYGDITIEYVDSSEIKLDPYTRKYDLTDSRYLIRDILLDVDELAAMHPKKQEEIKAAPPAGVESASPEGREMKVLQEIWYKEYEKQYYLMNRQDGKIEGPFEGEMLEEAQRFEEEDPDTYKILDYVQPVMYWKEMVGDIVLDEGRSPFNHQFFPYVPFFGEFIPKFKDLQLDTVGIIRDLRDPQREKNKRRSHLIDVITREIATGWMWEEGSVKNVKDMKKAGTKPNYHIIVNPGSWGKVQRMDSPPVNQGVYGLDELSDRDILEISGINPAQLGFVEGSRESGKSIALRQQQGVTMLSPYQDNMRATRHLIAKILISLIPQIYSVERVARIITEDGKLETLLLNQRYVDEAQGTMQILNNITVGKYDVAISETPSTPTTRQAEFTELMEMRQAGIPIDPSLIAQASDIPYKQEIVAGIKKMQQQAQQQGGAAE